jgi:hypothetical protein
MMATATAFFFFFFFFEQQKCYLTFSTMGIGWVLLPDYKAAYNVKI